MLSVAIINLCEMGGAFSHFGDAPLVQRRRFTASWLLLTLAACCPLGCGRASHELATAPVSGQVTLDGKPLTSGYVIMMPPQGRMARGAIQPDGSFVMGTYTSDDGAQVGQLSVAVTPMPVEEGGQASKGVPVPLKYGQAQTSGLSIGVQPGEQNKVEFALTTEPS
jgi:hypothetical protein